MDLNQNLLRMRGKDIYPTGATNCSTKIQKTLFYDKYNGLTVPSYIIAIKTSLHFSELAGKYNTNLMQ